MISTELIVRNRSGIHTRPAANIVKLTSKFRSEISFIRDGFRINAKSIIGVMTLAAEQGSQIILEVDGEDEENATIAIQKLFEEGFGEL